MDYMEFAGELKKAGNIIIYGARIYAENVYTCLSECFDIKAKFFTVTDKHGNPDTIENLPVYAISEVPDYAKNYTVVIAVPELYQNEIKNLLCKYGFHNIVPIPALLNDSLMTHYFSALYERRGKTFSVLKEAVRSVENTSDLTDSEFINIYMAKCQFDKPLKENRELPSWIVPIQAGAALADRRIAEVSDDSGDNISEKNKNYCELTAVYWMWKHSSAEYVGLCHYRRYLSISDNIKKIPNSDIDVILPTPVLVYPNAYSHHTLYIKNDDWRNMMSVLKRMYPDYYEASKAIFSERTFYLHNIWIMKKEHLDKFCEWLFSILFEVEKLCEPYGTVRHDRYMGYLGESLTSLYFLYNKNKLKIAHAAELMRV